MVAVVDTGADFRHPDLRPNLIAKAGSNLLRNTGLDLSLSPPPR